MPIDMHQKLKHNRKLLGSNEPIIMGILNVTPDSFSDGGKFSRVEAAVEHAVKMEKQGAHIIDIGGESTRPGAEPVVVHDEINRVVPVIEKLSQVSDVLISIDTSKPEVMEAAIRAGASMVNDVNALQENGAVEVCAQLNVPVCLMHMQGEPRTMQKKPTYNEVVTDVVGFLRQRIKYCIDNGIAKEHIIIDPGFGFGKTLEQNLMLLKRYDEICELNFPVMMGVSRKSMLGQVTGNEVDDRLIPGLAAVTVAYQKGGRVFRVHDVKETKETLLLCEAVKNVN